MTSVFDNADADANADAEPKSYEDFWTMSSLYTIKIPRKFLFRIMQFIQKPNN